MRVPCTCASSLLHQVSRIASLEASVSSSLCGEGHIRQEATRQKLTSLNHLSYSTISLRTLSHIIHSVKVYPQSTTTILKLGYLQNCNSHFMYSVSFIRSGENCSIPKYGNFTPLAVGIMQLKHSHP